MLRQPLLKGLLNDLFETGCQRGAEEVTEYGDVPCHMNVRWVNPHGDHEAAAGNFDTATVRGPFHALDHQGKAATHLIDRVLASR